VKKIAYGVGIEGCFTQNGAAVVFKSKDGDVDVKASEKRDYSSDLYYGSVTAFDTPATKSSRRRSPISKSARARSSLPEASFSPRCRMAG